MNLKEKIQTILMEDSGNLQKICFIKDLADQHAIGFVKWSDDLNIEDWSGQTTEELLEIYKKEKGL